jgi:hypothetical protein
MSMRGCREHVRPDAVVSGASGLMPRRWAPSPGLCAISRMYCSHPAECSRSGRGAWRVSEALDPIE